MAGVHGQKVVVVGIHEALRRKAMYLNIPSVHLEIELSVQRHWGRPQDCRQKNRFCPEMHFFLPSVCGGAALAGGCPETTSSAVFEPTIDVGKIGTKVPI
jgi:hypothetical protein